MAGAGCSCNKVGRASPGFSFNKIRKLACRGKAIKLALYQTKPMSTNLLYLFSNDTGATATEQGYHYQKLKTLKTWVENRVTGKEELIYCDTDDDIVQRDLAAGKTKFRQLKLYSTNFSFSTEEVTKSLANFFMLYAKGDYLFDEVVFVFETNANIAKETRGNDADLLREWAANQGKLDEELSAKCVARVKEILDGYITDGYAKEKAKDYEGAFLKAKNMYEQLPDDFWKSFVQAVRWDFEVIPQEQAIPQLTVEIEALIKQLPFPLNEEQISSYVATLHWEIVQRTIDADPERRVLSNGLLDYLVLHQGNEQNRWYADRYDKWSASPKVERFNTGQFLEVVAATRHCRWELAGTGHAQFWLGILHQYINLADVPMPFRRKAIYEYLFLKMQAGRAAGKPDPTIAADGALVVDYYLHLEERYALADIEEDLSFLQIITAEARFSAGFAEPAAIEAWGEQVAASIDEHLKAPRDVNEHCLLLEQKGTALMQLKKGMHDIEKVKAAMDTFRKIVPLLPAANNYTISRLSDLLKQIADLYRMLGEKFEEIVDEIETFRREIAALAPETDRRHKAAHDYVISGVTHLQAGGARNLLRALDAFHQAAKLWQMNETMDAYILALLNMAQVYNALGANYAGKYYALCGVWSSLHTGDEKALAKMGDSYGLVFHADFRQGAWLSAMGDYILYMNYRNEFKTGDPAADEMVNQNFLDLLLMVETAHRVHPELVHLIGFYKTQLGAFYSEEMAHLVEPFKKHVTETEDIHSFIADRIEDTPFNDAGSERIIRFKMLGVTWHIRFENTYILTAIAEEFAALFQIILCEIGLSGADLRLPSRTVQINVMQSDDDPEPMQDNKEPWIITIPHRDEHNPARARMHYAALGTSIMYLLIMHSERSREEIKAIFEKLYKKQQMGEKALSATSYQRAYFKAFGSTIFEQSGRQHFPQVPGRFDRPLRDSLAYTIKQPAATGEKGQAPDASSES
jgi:hypothetical protein